MGIDTSNLNLGNLLGGFGGDLGSLLDNPIVKAGVGMLEDLAKSVFSGAPAGEKGPFGKTIDLKLGSITISLPNPLYKLNSLLGGIGDLALNGSKFLETVGKFLTGGMRSLGDGNSVTVPGLADRSGSMLSNGGNILSALMGALTGGAAGSAGSSQGTGGSNPYSGVANDIYSKLDAGNTSGGPIASGGASGNGSDIFTPDEQKMLADLTPAERKRFELQRRMEEHTQNVTLLSTLQKLKHDAQMAIIQNVK